MFSWLYVFYFVLLIRSKCFLCALFVCGGVVVVAVVLVFGKCGCLKVSFTTHKRIFFGVHFGCFGFVFRSVFCCYSLVLLLL